MCSDVRVFEAANGAGRKPGPRQVQVHRCGEVAEYIQEVIGNDEVDLVHVEGFYLMQHVPVPSACPILLVEQNVEYQLWLQRVAVEPDAARRDAYLAQLRSTWTEEIAAWQRSDLVAVLTEEDRAVLAAHPGLDVRIVPDGADHVRPARFDRARSVAGEPLVVFVANFGYEPNQDAARFLCEEIVPRVVGEVPAARFLLVGTSPPDDLREVADACPNVLLVGRVPAVEPYLDTAQVVVAPLRIGGGIKVKVLEALARGRPIVATSVAAQGLGSAGADCTRIADDPESFARAVVRLLRRPEERDELARQARAFARTLPSWDVAAAKLAACYRELVPVASRRTASVA
jgi:polysaccharide biosynthesis protein PslH